MNDAISASIGQTTGLSRFVKTSDGIYAYINSMGMAKPFATSQDYLATVGKNGCPNAVAVSIDRTWHNIQYPIGSTMTAGQACGNENTYVTNSFPADNTAVSNAFDKSYYERIAGTTFASSSAAYSNWSTTGRANGLSPYEGALNVSNLSKSGYIDVDGEFHQLTSTFTDTYGPAIGSYITGKNMTSCSPSTRIHYRSPVYIKTGNSYLSINGDRVQTSDSSGKSLFYIQVPINSIDTTTTITSTMYTDGINYGDSFVLGTTSASNPNGSCYYWGCNVGSVTGTTFALMNNSHYSTNLQLLSANSVSTGTGINYQESCYITGTIFKNVLMDQTIMSEPLICGNFKLSYTNSSLIITNTTDDTSTTLFTAACTSTSIVALGGGRFYFWERGSNAPCDIYPGRNVEINGAYPYKAKLTNTGLLKVVDSQGTLQWSHSSSIQDGTDSPVTVYATIDSSKLTFTQDISLRGTFSFINSDTSASAACSQNTLQTTCNNSSTCVGYVHSSIDNTVQYIQAVESPVNYKISATDTNVYLRQVQSNRLTGTNCPRTQQGIRSVDLSAYPKGIDISRTTDMCTPIPSIGVSAYTDDTKRIKDIMNATVPDASVDDLPDYSSKMKDGVSELQNKYTAWQNARGNTPISHTLEQRKVDTQVLDEHYKMQAILWGIISISMVAIILFRPNN